MPTMSSPVGGGGGEVVLPAGALCVQVWSCLQSFPDGWTIGWAASSPMSGVVDGSGSSNGDFVRDCHVGVSRFCLLNALKLDPTAYGYRIKSPREAKLTHICLDRYSPLVAMLN